jgi:hypothetical protein
MLIWKEKKNPLLSESNKRHVPFDVLLVIYLFIVDSIYWGYKKKSNAFEKPLIVFFLTILINTIYNKDREEKINNGTNEVNNTLISYIIQLTSLAKSLTKSQDLTLNKSIQDKNSIII